MGIRGIARDVLSLYLGFEIIRGYVSGEFATVNISVAGMVLFAIAVWFMLERMGVIPKFG